MLNYNYLQARFSKVPVITEPPKAVLFAFKIEFLIALKIIQLGNK